MGAKRIVFVCSGNICRSPMAAELARAKLKAASIDAVIISAGTLNIMGSPAAPHAVEAMRQIGLSIDEHRSQGLSLDLVRLADQVVVMGPEHRESIVQKDASLSPKIQPLWEFAEPRGRLEEIADPVGMDLEAFVRCRLELETCLDRWVDHLRALG
jgi:protein-tyrosine-phosphatase